MVEAAGDDEKELAAQMAAEFLNEDLSEQQFGAPKAGPGMWASILRMLDPIKVLKDGTWEELAYSQAVTTKQVYYDHGSSFS